MSNFENSNLDEQTIKRDFRVLKLLSENAFCNTVLMCDDNGQMIVRKKINISRLSEFERNLCLNEIEIVSKISHPFIVKYICSYLERKHLCIVTEYCKGGDLHKYLAYRKKLNKPLSEKRILIWLAQILSGLKFLHDRHILHRDLKSLNILIDSRKNLKICDFGVSKSLNHTSDSASTLIGTPYYFSPELVNGFKYSFPSDIWALGCITYELCTFKTPFHGAKGILELTKMINERNIPDLPSTYSSDLNALYKSMMFHDLQFRLTVNELISTDLIQDVLKQMLKDAQLTSKSIENDTIYDMEKYMSYKKEGIPGPAIQNKIKVWH